MKTKLVTLCLTSVLVFSASAATINVARGISQPGISVSAFSGTALSAGGFYMSVGSYTFAPVVTDYASLLTSVNSLNIFGAASTSSTTIPGILQLAAGITYNGGATPELWNSKEIYLVVGNGTTKANSTDFAILRTATATFFPANVSPVSTVTFAVPNGAAITPVSGAGTVSGNILTLQGVPEPSAALLGALGALGLLRRRRI